jgi:hypothetical protein
VTEAWLSRLIDITLEDDLAALNLVAADSSPLATGAVDLSELILVVAETTLGEAGATEAATADAGAVEASGDLTSWRDIDVYSLGNSAAPDEGEADEKEANILIEQDAAVLGRARWSAGHGLPAASTTPQAPRVDLATASPAPPPIPTGAPGLTLGSYVSSETEDSSLGSVFFMVGDTGPHGEHYSQLNATKHSQLQASFKDVDASVEPALAGLVASSKDTDASVKPALAPALVETAPSVKEELAPTTAPVEERIAPAPTRTPAPAIRSLVPPASRSVAFTVSPADYVAFTVSPAEEPPSRAADADTLMPSVPVVDTVSRRLSLSALGPHKRDPGRGLGSNAIASAESQCGLAPGSFVFVSALACGMVIALVAYSHSERLAVVTGAGTILASVQMQREGVDGVVEGLRWTISEGAGGLIAAARWVFNMVVMHTQFVVILLLLAYIATAGASSVKGADAAAREGSTARTLDQLTSGSARYDAYCPLLTKAEAVQMHVELLAGNEPPPGLHDAIAKCLVIVDTGCGRSMGNHPVQFKAGSIRKDEATASGAHGAFVTKFKGTWAMPMQTESHGIRVCNEYDAVLHEECPYALWSPGRASIERGVSLSMPGWGEDGFFEFPNSIRICFFNHFVLVLRPLGYKESPRHAPALLGATDGSSPPAAPASAPAAAPVSTLGATGGSPHDAPVPAATPAGNLIHGKALPRVAVTAKLLHRICGHLPRRDLIHLPDAWCDAPPYWTTDVLKETKEALCEACIRANAPRASPSGELPSFDGMYFLDILHVATPAYFGGQRTVVGVTHSTSGFVKSVPVLRKSQAADAMRIIIHFLNSVGKPVKWIHTDGAHELKGAGMIDLANEHQIRITTSNVGSSRQNKQEPTWRATCAAMRTELAQSGLPHSFWLHAFSHAEQGRNLCPSRAAPFDTRLGRLLGRKPKGAYRRPYGCLCYVLDAPRYVGGTLVNKVAAQAQRAIHLGYYGDEGGSLENLETKGERAKPGYLCFVPDAGHRGAIIVTDAVKFVVDCFPGIKRVAGGGYEIPSDKIPFAGDTQSGGAAPIDISPLREIHNEDDVIDSSVEIEGDLEAHPGFAPEANESLADGDDSPTDGDDSPDREDDDATGDGLDNEGPAADPKRYVGRRVVVCWGPYGESTGIIDAWAHRGAHGHKHHITYDDPDGKWPNYDDTHRWHDLGNHDIKWWFEDETPPAAPFSGDRRPTRERREPERYSLTTLIANYTEASGAGFSVSSSRVSSTAMHVDLAGQVDRIAERAKSRADVYLNYSDEVKGAFLALPPEAQASACVAADHADISAEYGASSPQAALVREVYAAAALAAALKGIAVPPIEPVAVSVIDKSLHASVDDMFDDAFDGGGLFNLGRNYDGEYGPDIACSAKKSTSNPDILTERQMRGPEWDEPKSMEIDSILNKLMAAEKVAADDPRIRGMVPVDTMWTGRRKRNADGTIDKYKARCVLRGDIHIKKYDVSRNDTASPVARNTSLMAVEAIACLRGQDQLQSDFTGAYLQGVQKESEQVLARPPPGFREADERGVEILWLMLSPLYGQADAGAIWNRTLNDFLVAPEPGGLGFERNVNDPCVYTRTEPGGGRVTYALYVDDARLYNDPTPAARELARRVQSRLKERFEIKFGETNPKEDYFLGANRISHGPHATTIRCDSYIDSMVERYLPGVDAYNSSKRFPGSYSDTPAGADLTANYESAIILRPEPTDELKKRYGSLFGALLHAIKWRPEISAALGLCGTCLTICTEELYANLERVLVYLARTKKIGTTFSAHTYGAKKLRAYADANWTTTRSTTGFVIMLAGGAIAHASRRQHCISMSTCEAELIALADCAIELLYIIGLLLFLGHEIDEAIEVYTDNKAAYDLCHRFNSAQNSRHIDRKLFKMRELRGLGVVTVAHVPTAENPADLFTKVLDKQPFDKHRKTVHNLSGDTGTNYARRAKSIERRAALKVKANI